MPLTKTSVTYFSPGASSLSPQCSRKDLPPSHFLRWSTNKSRVNLTLNTHITSFNQADVARNKIYRRLMSLSFQSIAEGSRRTHYTSHCWESSGSSSASSWTAAGFPKDATTGLARRCLIFSCLHFQELVRGELWSATFHINFRGTQIWSLSTNLLFENAISNGK